MVDIIVEYRGLPYAEDDGDHMDVFSVDEHGRVEYVDTIDAPDADLPAWYAVDGDPVLVQPMGDDET